MREEKALQQSVLEIEQLIRDVESASDPGLRETVQKTVQLLMDIHGGALERIMTIVSEAGEAGQQIIGRFDRDDAVRSLLLLYGLHHLDLKTRVLRAIENLRPSLRAHQGSAELLGVSEGVVRVRLSGGTGCGASAVKSAVEDAIYQAAPDVAELVLEGPAEAPSPAAFVPLAKLLNPDSRVQQGSDPS
jgi:Fe-S cluster biogenesis protein NfuA